ncbi:dihydroorotase [Saccharicrinis sp. FJH62]|uniref:dihydroorotase n=1 Tax=Saccharicrinis sp. FJH62 TaxID=3344657 RepID=UPI0035D3FB7E
MTHKILIFNAEIINENERFAGSVLIEDEVIKEIFKTEVDPQSFKDIQLIDATGLILLPGVIDDQVHFRDPGLTHKGDIYTEAKAAVAGGITSYMEMPNTKPQAVTIEILEDKYKSASEKSLANYSFFMGATNDNIEELKKVDPEQVCGVKIFMGSSTGNMLVDNKETLENIFSEIPLLIATHCEDEATIQANIQKAKQQFGEDVPIEQHPLIRSAEACYLSSSFAVSLAKKFNARLHILHLSTQKELELFDNSKPLREKNITAEVCVHHLLFDDSDYSTKGTLIKWNPSVKTKEDKEALLQGIISDKVDVVATDHAPHLWEEKHGGALKAMSGGPMVQHSLVAMLEFVKNKKLSYEKVVQKMCHAPAVLFNVKERGFIREGYKADLVLVDPDNASKVTKDNILYKCGWSPLEGMTFSHSIMTTFVNGHKVYDVGIFDESVKGQRLRFTKRPI